MLVAILIFVLRPKDLSFSNSVGWITGQPGIRFGKYGIAYTARFLASIREKADAPNGFSVEIALKPAEHAEEIRIAV